MEQGRKGVTICKESRGERRKVGRGVWLPSLGLARDLGLEEAPEGLWD